MEKPKDIWKGADMKNDKLDYYGPHPGHMKSKAKSAAIKKKTGGSHSGIKIRPNVKGKKRAAMHRLANELSGS